MGCYRSYIHGLFSGMSGCWCSNYRKKHIWLSVYRHLCGNEKKILNNFTEILVLVSNRKWHDIYIIGDFYLDLLICTENISIYEFINSFSLHSFSIFPFTTKLLVTDPSAKITDLIWSIQVESKLNNLIIHNDIWDHFPVLSQFEIQSQKNKPKIISKRSLTNNELEDFSHELGSKDWSPDIASNYPTKSFNFFFHCFDMVFKKHSPAKQYHINYSLTSLQPWKSVLKINIDWRY